MAELHVGVGVGAVERQGAAVGGLGLDVVALLLQGVAELHPDPHQRWFALQRLAIIGSGGGPIARIPGAVAFLDQPPVQVFQFLGRIRHPRVEMRRLRIGLGGLIEPALQFHQMAELQMRVGRGALKRQGTAIGDFGAGIIAALLHRMPELHPKRHQVGVPLERPAVMPFGPRPVAIAGGPTAGPAGGAGIALPYRRGHLPRQAGRLPQLGVCRR